MHSGRGRRRSKIDRGPYRRGLTRKSRADAGSYEFISISGVIIVEDVEA
jgi:hypothetical protein